MKKISALFLLTLFLSSCAAYKFQRSHEPNSKGYLVARDGYIIPEYTAGKDQSLPDLALAKARLKERRRMVEHYYKKMDFIENNFKATFYDPAANFAKIAFGVFRLPFIAVSDYRYEHNPKYRERMKEIEDEKEAMEEARINKLKEELNAYIQTRLAREGQ